MFGAVAGYVINIEVPVVADFGGVVNVSAVGLEDMQVDIRLGVPG